MSYKKILPFVTAMGAYAGEKLGVGRAKEPSKTSKATKTKKKKRKLSQKSKRRNR